MLRAPGQGRGKRALPLPRDMLQRKPPRAEPRTKKGAGVRERKRRGGERSVTLTLLHAKKRGSSGAPRPVLAASAGACCPRAAPTCCSWVLSATASSGAVPTVRQPVGLHPLSKAPSECARKGTEQHLSTPRGFHPGGTPQHLTCRGLTRGLPQGLRALDEGTGQTATIFYSLNKADLESLFSM